MSAFGPLRQFAATQHFLAFRGKRTLTGRAYNLRRGMKFSAMTQICGIAQIWAMALFSDLADTGERPAPDEPLIEVIARTVSGYQPFGSDLAELGSVPWRRLGIGSR